MHTKTTPICFRLPLDLKDRMDALQADMGRQVGVKVDQSKLIRLLLERGLEILEQEREGKKP